MKKCSILTRLMIYFTVKGYTILPQKNDEAIMRELFLNGPIQVSMHFYDDFRWYERGEFIA